MECPQPGRRGHLPPDPRRHRVGRGSIAQPGTSGAGLDRCAPPHSADCCAIACRAVDGRKVLLSVRNSGGGSTSARRQFLDNLGACGPKQPECVIVDGDQDSKLRPPRCIRDLPIQRCSVHNHRNLLGLDTQHMQDELTEDCHHMIHAVTAVGDQAATKGLPAQVAADTSAGRRPSRDSERPALHLHPPRRTGNRPGRPTPSRA